MRTGAVLRDLLAPAGLMLAIFLVSSVPGPSPDNPGWSGFLRPAVQNLLHIPLFALLAWLWARSLTRLWALDGVRATAIATLIAIFYGICDELHQFFVPGRYASGTDVLLDAAGSVMGGLIWWTSQRSERA